MCFKILWCFLKQIFIAAFVFVNKIFQSIIFLWCLTACKETLNVYIEINLQEFIFIFFLRGVLYIPDVYRELYS